MIQLGSSKAIFAQEDRNKPNFADPNIVRVELHKLSEHHPSTQHSPSQCSQCHSFYSDEEVLNFKWKCKYCETENDFHPSEQERNEDKDYFVEKKEVQLNTESTIVFCIDTSGSMGGHPIQCVKNAIIEQITTLKESNSHQKICIVQFSSSVQILGDCCHGRIDIPEKMMHDYDSLVDIAKDRVELFDIQQSADKMKGTVGGMYATGMTALGPAVLVSTVLAGKESNGQVILCTDGCANVGLEGRAFYDQVSDYALQHGVVININTVDGCQANVSQIREMSMKTGGSVSVLRIEDVGESFADMMSNKLVAKQAQMTIHLPQTVVFDDLDYEIIKKNNEKKHQDGTLSHITIYKGNVIDDSDFYFRYKLRNSNTQIQSFPIQVVVEYTKLNGEKWRRISNKTIEVAAVGEQCENNGEIIQAYYIRRVGETKRQGNVYQSRQNIQMFRNAQMNYYQANQQAYTDVIDEYEYGMDHEHVDDYYSSKTISTANFSNKRMFQQQKIQKMEFKMKSQPCKPNNYQNQFIHPIHSHQQRIPPQQHFAPQRIPQYQNHISPQTIQPQRIPPPQQHMNNNNISPINIAPQQIPPPQHFINNNNFMSPMNFSQQTIPQQHQPMNLTPIVPIQPVPMSQMKSPSPQNHSPK